MIKKAIKLTILILFLYDRYFYFKELNKTDTSLMHSVLTNDYKINVRELDRNYDMHPLFTLPYSQNLVESLQNYLIKRYHYNTTKIHQNTSKESYHSYDQSTVDFFIKFRFGFVTLYDLVTFITLLYFITTDSFKALGLLLLDTGLKVLTHEWLILIDFVTGDNLHMLTKCIKDAVGFNFECAKDMTVEFLKEGRYILTNSTILALLFLIGLQLLAKEYKHVLLGETHSNREELNLRKRKRE